MRATFERGDPQAPRGHAIVFVREAGNPSQFRASYLVIAPIQMDFAKYIPPMFAGQLSAMVPSGPTALPLPPIPEPVESLEWLERLAEARHDDLLDGGQVDASNPQQLIFTMTELASEYAALWTDYAARLAAEPRPEQELAAGALTDVDDLLLSLMNDSEKVSRVARLAGTLRYAVEVADTRLEHETAGEMERIGRQLSDTYRVAELVAAARRPDQEGEHLLTLFVDRAYKLASEDYVELKRIDREIDRLTAD